ncbi:MAG: hypothetical protein LBF88_13860 [Planctomycetaceae bacterium]|jgi:hypothetical protein|nr:hypothetical protein [Planctomycetaceae bacterium]
MFRLKHRVGDSRRPLWAAGSRIVGRKATPMAVRTQGQVGYRRRDLGTQGCLPHKIARRTMPPNYSVTESTRRRKGKPSGIESISTGAVSQEKGSPAC